MAPICSAACFICLVIPVPHVCLCIGLVPYGGPERRLPLCEDVFKALDRDDAALLAAQYLSVVFNTELMDVNSASIFSIFSRTRVGGMAVGWDGALPSKHAWVHTSCI